MKLNLKLIITIFLLTNSLFNCRLKMKSNNLNTLNTHLNLRMEKNRSTSYIDKFKEFKDSLQLIIYIDIQAELDENIKNFKNTFKKFIDVKNTEYAKKPNSKFKVYERNGFGFL